MDYSSVTVPHRDANTHIRYEYVTYTDPCFGRTNQLKMVKMFNKTVMLKDVTEATLAQIRTAIDNDDSFECMSSIVCALQKFSLDELLTLHEYVKQRFPYLATVSSGI